MTPKPVTIEKDNVDCYWLYTMIYPFYWWTHDVREIDEKYIELWALEGFFQAIVDDAAPFSVSMSGVVEFYEGENELVGFTMEDVDIEELDRLAVMFLEAINSHEEGQEFMPLYNFLREIVDENQPYHEGD